MIKQLLLTLLCGISLPLWSQNHVIPNEYLVQLRHNTKAKTSDHLIPVFKALDIYLLKSTDAAETKRILNQDDVVYWQANHQADWRQSCQETTITPNDPRFDEQWNLTKVNVAEAWAYTTGGLNFNGDTIVMAVIDAGGDQTHEDLAPNLWHNHQEIPNNNIDDDQNGFVDDYDGWNVFTANDQIPLSSHGTSVMGILGAKTDNNKGIAGINWNAKIMPLAITNITEAEVLTAYDYVFNARTRYNTSNGAEGAYVVAVNASFGIDAGKPNDYPLWCAVFDQLGQAGILSVAATTNNAYNVDFVGDIPTACTSDYLVTVTASRQDDRRVSDAGYGVQSIDLLAPGDNRNGYWLTATTSNNSYGPFFATSCAAPHVTGAIGLLYALPLDSFAQAQQLSPAATALRVKAAILNSVDLVQSTTPETVSGGRLNIGNSIKLLAKDFGVQGEGLSLKDAFPNPLPQNAPLYLRFDIAQAEPFSIEIYNSNGQLVFSDPRPSPPQIGTWSYPIDTHNWAAGVYIARLGSKAIKIVKL